MVLDSQLLAEVLRCVIVELLSIVRDEDPWDFEVVNDAFLNEASDIFLFYSSQWLCLDPFGEVIDPYDKKLELPYGDWEGSHYVQSLLGEWPRGTHWCKFL